MCSTKGLSIPAPIHRHSSTHSQGLATLYKDISAMILFMLFYVLFITMLCINNHIEYKKK
jgi:hypothetical protein